MLIFSHVFSNAEKEGWHMIHRITIETSLFWKIHFENEGINTDISNFECCIFITLDITVSISKEEKS